MKKNRPSMTAAQVAAYRGLGSFLRQEDRLAEDPYGLRFGGAWSRALGAVFSRAPRLGERILERGPLGRLVGWLQLRTRAIDDAVMAFARGDGRQIVILGAGYDSRASRLSSTLAHTTVFEIDHPATSARKARILEELAPPSARVVRLEWDFETRPVGELPAALSALGHAPGEVTLTLWEGVTMYLSEPAIEATVAAVHALSSPGSRFIFNYLDRAAIDHPDLVARAAHFIGEPMVFGWDPLALPAWLRARGFVVVRDRSDFDLGAELLPHRDPRAFSNGMRRIATAERL